MVRRIYMDNAATTPLDPRVLEAMKPYLGERFGNAASAGHAYGWEAEEAVKLAREQVADLVGASPREIVWTSGATESNNLALKGAAEFYRGKGRHLITGATEHSAVLDCAAHLKEEGWDLTILPVDGDGRIDLDRLAQAIRPDTVLVSLMAANNETGVMHPLAEIGRITRERECLLHVDAAQAFGKIPLDVEAMGIDLMSVSAHKLYGPKGVGALYVRQRGPRVRLAPQMHGGGHESGLRSGTLNVPGIVGLGEAARLAGACMDEEGARLAGMGERLASGIRSELEQIALCGEGAPRLKSIATFCFAGADAESLLTALRGIALSSGAACASSKPGPSHVLLAMGFSTEQAHSALRFSLGRFNEETEVTEVAARVAAAVTKLRETKPLKTRSGG